MVERKQPLVGEGGKELDDEERVARGLLVHQLHQRGGARWLAATSLSRKAPISIRCFSSDRIIRSSSRSRVAASSHCRSSRKIASGCSGRAKTPRNRRSTNWKRRCASCGGSSGTGGCSPMISSSSGTRFTISCPFGSSAPLSASRQRASSASLLLRIDWISLRKAWASVAYGTSRLCWSNFPEAKRPRGGTSALCNSLTTDDLPMPEYPETSTNSGLPLVTTRSKAASSVSTSRERP